MFGTNPKTGKPIRILKSDATIWRNDKTAVWLHPDTVQARSDRYETVCVGLDHYKQILSKRLRVDTLILLDPTPEALQFVRTKQLHHHLVLFLARSLATALGEKEFLALQLSNVICLEEVHQVFPFVGKDVPWDMTTEDAVTLAALILRATTLLGISHDRLSSKRLEALATMKIEFMGKPLSEIPQLWFLTQYYKPDKGRREREIKKCLEQNVKCSMIDKIILLNEKDYSDAFPKDSQKKIQQVVIGKRLTYSLVLQWFQANAPANTICVFANSDIYLDESARTLWTVNLADRFLSLLRWDVEDETSQPKLFGPRPDSQDTWMFLSDSIKSRTFNWEDLNFPFGKAGCDNAINVEMLRKKFLIVNPAYSIRTYHVHSSAIRTYDPTDIVDKPMYFYVEPTGIHDMEPVQDLSKYAFKTLSSEAFDRPIKGVSERALDTYCTMITKQEVFPYSRSSSNHYECPSILVNRYQNIFHTAQGLLYDTRRIFVGRTESSQKAWSEAKLSPLVPSFHAKKTLCAPLTQDMLKNPESFLLYYISRILQMKAEVGLGEFWAPQHPRLMDSLQLFDWGTTSDVSVLPLAPNAQVWADEVIQWAPRDTDLLRKEDIQCLRDALQMKWRSKRLADENKRYVVMVDEFCNGEWVQELEQALPDIDFQCLFVGRSSPNRYVERLLGADGIIFVGGPKSEERWGWNWLLPEGAQVLELQNEMEPDGYAVHLSGAASLHHVVLTFPRGKQEFQRKEAIRQIVLAIQPQSPAPSPKATLPVLHMPRHSLQGFFGHPGDSFREMARLWADAGLVTLVEHPTAVQIWLGEVGGCLLYDRPTMEWLQAAPPNEQLWKKALFGNPAPFGTNSQSWFFWPRRPQYVEEIVQRGLPKRSYGERSQRLVFYGKIENRVQERRRTTADWASACDEFVMPKGDEKPYIFTQQEYLERLTNARYGLCLAGYGKKCHREVECMSMGTVPIVAPDVDMTNYANAPQEGVHYLRAATPEEAKALSETTTEEMWTTMSAACRIWWQENCSVQGSWALTKRLLGDF